MDFTPVLPYDNDGTIDSKLLFMAEKLCIKSATLAGSYAPQILDEIKELLRKVNSYYSNQIESEGTHPIDIDRATKKLFSKDTKQKQLQLLSLVHIQMQKYVENYFIEKTSSAFSKNFILDIHCKLYSSSDMKPFLKIKDKLSGKTINMTPGKLRLTDVKVGQHIAPNYKELDSLLDKYELLYKFSNNTTKANRVIIALSSHHRLTWLHPFLDGNGRTSRLILDGIFSSLPLEGYGLWNISRGLSRESQEYKKYLMMADMVRQGDLDGRGALSTIGLKSYVEFMLKVALNQVDFMSKCLKMDTLSKRIENYIKLSREELLEVEPLPKYSELLFKELLIAGELPRGKVKDIINTKDRTATSLIKELTKLDYIKSTTQKSPIRLNFNARFASYIFPELIPK